ncbi:Uncharacterised protein [Vibrio cholerae]|nr:Uncharacterised protein [Vibrio cholerae]CRZ74174.1 Uncharacterised protein [Vibrio cholerae]CSA73659.1 Uncharacterised protein [Vibrio cholerae]CSB43216.1 Uncharacterised protein [Vibrio cholerae]CSB53353.1 Uncharacterised protein [Vibrio cholerae]
MASKTSTRFTVNVECCVSTMLKQAFYLIRVFCNGCDLALIVALLQLLKGNLVSLMVRHSQQHQLDFAGIENAFPKIWVGCIARNHITAFFTMAIGRLFTNFYPKADFPVT